MITTSFSDFTEDEYDLEGIGIDGYYLVVEEDIAYIYSSNFYVEIPNKNNLGRLVKKVDREGKILIEDYEGNLLQVTKNQYDILLEIVEVL